MTATRELARGVVMVGISGTEVDSNVPCVGGYLLFGGAGVTLQAIRSLTDALRAREHDPPPIIAVDQEGGPVARLREGVEPMPPMMALGAADDVELAQRAGEQTAFDLRRGGCTIDFAPVLDLALESQNVVIGSRAIGEDPQRVGSLGAAFADGMRRGGILPCFKHFPGHGSTSADSHQTLPIIGVDEWTLRARDLVPFAAVARSAPAMMSAHVLLRALDAQHPVTLSRRVLIDVLRGELGFGGTLVTDCLEMEAVAVRGAVESALDALEAGADLLLFSHRPDLAVATVEAIERAIAAGRISLERLAEAYDRVVWLRHAASAPIELDTFPPHPGVGREIARRAITLVRGMPHVDPVASIAVSFGGAANALQREAPALQCREASLEPSRKEIRSLLEQLVQIRRRPVLLARRAHLHRQQADAIAAILDRYPDALVVSLREPFDVPLFATARHVLAAYGDDVTSIGGLADVMFGGTMPTGRLPVAVPSSPNVPLSS